MPAPKRLRAVSDSDTEQLSAPKNVAEAAESGDRRGLLVAMRDRIARAVSNPDCPPRDLASLTRRLQEIAREIDQIDLQGTGARSVVADTDDEPFSP